MDAVSDERPSTYPMCEATVEGTRCPQRATVEYVVDGRPVELCAAHDEQWQRGAVELVPLEPPDHEPIGGGRC